MDTETGEMIVKRVSVPIGLEELMEGLVKEVLLKKPDDIYLFAARYFTHLLTIRQKVPVTKTKTLRTIQTIKGKTDKPVNYARNSKLSKQMSIREDSSMIESPIISQKPKMYQRNELKYKRRNTGPPTVLPNNQQITIRRKYARSVSGDKQPSQIESNNNKNKIKNENKKDRQEDSKLKQDKTDTKNKLPVLAESKNMINLLENNNNYINTGQTMVKSAQDSHDQDNQTVHLTENATEENKPQVMQAKSEDIKNKDVLTEKVISDNKETRKLRSGKTIDDDEVSRVLLSSISNTENETTANILEPNDAKNTSLADSLIGEELLVPKEKVQMQNTIREKGHEKINEDQNTVDSDTIITTAEEHEVSKLSSVNEKTENGVKKEVKVPDTKSEIKNITVEHEEKINDEGKDTTDVQLLDTLPNKTDDEQTIKNIENIKELNTDRISVLEKENDTKTKPIERALSNDSLELCEDLELGPATKKNKEIQDTEKEHESQNQAIIMEHGMKKENDEIVDKLQISSKEDRVNKANNTITDLNLEVTSLSNLDESPYLETKQDLDREDESKKDRQVLTKSSNATDIDQSKKPNKPEINNKVGNKNKEEEFIEHENITNGHTKVNSENEEEESEVSAGENELKNASNNLLNSNANITEYKDEGTPSNSLLTTSNESGHNNNIIHTKSLDLEVKDIQQADTLNLSTNQSELNNSEKNADKGENNMLKTIESTAEIKSEDKMDSNKENTTNNEIDLHHSKENETDINIHPLKNDGANQNFQNNSEKADVNKETNQENINEEEKKKSDFESLILKDHIEATTTAGVPHKNESNILEHSEASIDQHISEEVNVQQIKSISTSDQQGNNNKSDNEREAGKNINDPNNIADIEMAHKGMKLINKEENSENESHTSNHTEIQSTTLEARKSKITDSLLKVDNDKNPDNKGNDDEDHLTDQDKVNTNLENISKNIINKSIEGRLSGDVDLSKVNSENITHDKDAAEFVIGKNAQNTEIKEATNLEITPNDNESEIETSDLVKTKRAEVTDNIPISAEIKDNIISNIETEDTDDIAQSHQKLVKETIENKDLKESGVADKNLGDLIRTKRSTETNEDMEVTPIANTDNSFESESEDISNIDDKSKSTSENNMVDRVAKNYVNYVIDNDRYLPTENDVSVIDEAQTYTLDDEAENNTESKSDELIHDNENQKSLGKASESTADDLPATLKHDVGENKPGVEMTKSTIEADKNTSAGHESHLHKKEEIEEIEQNKNDNLDSSEKGSLEKPSRNIKTTEASVGPKELLTLTDDNEHVRKSFAATKVDIEEPVSNKELSQSEIEGDIKMYKKQLSPLQENKENVGESEQNKNLNTDNNASQENVDSHAETTEESTAFKETSNLIDEEIDSSKIKYGTEETGTNRGLKQNIVKTPKKVSEVHLQQNEESDEKLEHNKNMSLEQASNIANQEKPSSNVETTKETALFKEPSTLTEENDQQEESPVTLKDDRDQTESSRESQRAIQADKKMHQEQKNKKSLEEPEQKKNVKLEEASPKKPSSDVETTKEAAVFKESSTLNDENDHQIGSPVTLKDDRDQRESSRELSQSIIETDNKIPEGELSVLKENKDSIEKSEPKENINISNNAKQIETNEKGADSKETSNLASKDDHQTELRKRAEQLINSTLSISQTGLIEHKVKNFLNDFIHQEKTNAHSTIPNRKEVDEKHIEKKETSVYDQANITETKKAVSQPVNGIKKCTSFDSSKLREELKKVEAEAKYTQFKTSYNPHMLHKEIEEANQHEKDLELTPNLVDMEKVADAVVKIQALWRGFKFRKEMKQNRSEKENVVSGLTKLSSPKKIVPDNSKIREEHPESAKSGVQNNSSEKSSKPEDLLQSVIAALIIQRIWRGYKVRKNLNRYKRGIDPSKDQTNKETRGNVQNTEKENMKQGTHEDEREASHTSGAQNNENSSTAEENFESDKLEGKRIFSAESTDSVNTVIFNDPKENTNTKLDFQHSHYPKEVNHLLDEAMDYPTEEEEHLLDNYQSKLLDKISGKEEDNKYDDIEAFEKIIPIKRIDDINLEQLKDEIYTPLVPKNTQTTEKYVAGERKLTKLSSKLEILEEESNDEENTKHLIDSDIKSTGDDGSSEIKSGTTNNDKLYTFCSEPSPIPCENKIIDGKPLSEHIEIISDKDNKETHDETNESAETVSKKKLHVTEPTPGNEFEYSETKSFHTSEVNNEDTEKVNESKLDTTKTIDNEFDSTAPNKHLHSGKVTNVDTETINKDKLVTSKTVYNEFDSTGSNEPLQSDDATNEDTETVNKGKLDTTRTSDNEFDAGSNKPLQSGEVHERLVIPLPPGVKQKLKDTGKEDTVDSEESNKSLHPDQISSILSSAGIDKEELHDTVVVPVNEHNVDAGRSQPISVQLCQTSGQVYLIIVLPSFPSDNRTDAENVMTSPAPPPQDVSIGVVATGSGNSSSTSSSRNAQDPGKADLRRGGPQSESGGHSGSHPESPESMESGKRRKTDGAIMEAQAATKIQAGFRGYQVRKQLKLKNDCSEITTSSKPTRPKTDTLQNESQNSEELEEQSAVKIQAGIRGFLVRRRQKKHNSQQA